MNKRKLYNQIKSKWNIKKLSTQLNKYVNKRNKKAKEKKDEKTLVTTPSPVLEQVGMKKRLRKSWQRR